MSYSQENIAKDLHSRPMKKRRKKRRKNLKFAIVFFALILTISGVFTYLYFSRKNAKKVQFANVSTEHIYDDLDLPVDLTPPDLELSITISVVGDCTLGTDENFNYSRSLNSYFEKHGADYFLKNVKPYFEADDLTIANLEGTFTDSTARVDKTYAFKGPFEFVNILTKGSVEAVTLANNHSRDYGSESLSDTKETLDNAGVVHFGNGETAVYETKGVKIGLVGIYELPYGLGCAQHVKDGIAKVKSDGADIIVVIFHWGTERDAAPDSTQISLAHLAIDEGADLVCGHHPHVLQGMETYKGKNIAYSLGNFCFGGNSNPSDKDTMIFQQTFTVTKDGLKEDNVTNIIPCSLSSVSYQNDYCPTPATGAEAERILNKIKERSALIPKQ